MKKIILLFIIFLMGITSLFSARFQVTPGIGYGINLLNNMSGKDLVVDPSGQLTKNEDMFYSGMAGLNLTLGLLYKIQETMAVELRYSYVMGPLTKTLNIIDQQTGTNRTEHRQTALMPIDLNIKFYARGKSFRPYAGAGLSFSAGSKSIWKIEEKQGVFGTEIKEEEIQYKPKLGINIFLGTEIVLTDNIGLDFTAILRQMSIIRKSSTITKWTRDGKDQLPLKTTKEIKAEYRENAAKADMDARTDAQPALFSAYSENMDALILSFGVIFKF